MTDESTIKVTGTDVLVLAASDGHVFGEVTKVVRADVMAFDSANFAAECANFRDEDDPGPPPHAVAHMMKLIGYTLDAPPGTVYTMTFLGTSRRPDVSQLGVPGCRCGCMDGKPRRGA